MIGQLVVAINVKLGWKCLSKFGYFEKLIWQGVPNPDKAFGRPKGT